MNDNNAKTWKTKHGVRRIRQEEPTLSEAIAAARDLSDDIDAQCEIAASLMGLPQDQVMAALLRQAKASAKVAASAPAKTPQEAPSPVAFSRPAAPQRTVVVEYKRASRR